MEICHGAGDHHAHILNAGKHPPSLILVEGVVELENVIETGCCQRPIGDRLCNGRLPGDGWNLAAVLVIEVGLESDIPACDRK